MSIWNTKTLFEITLAIQLVGFIAIFANITLLRQIVGFIFLSFIPGYMILKIIKINEISYLKVILFSLGFSVAFIMLIGLLINELYPIIGIYKPLSGNIPIISIYMVTILLSIIAYYRNKKYSNSIRINLILNTSILWIVCIPFLTIIGSIFTRYYGNNYILIILIIIISIITLCISSQKLFPIELYPLAIFMISLFLLFHISLMSNYIIGYDINLELYFARLTSINSMWNRSIPHEYNSILSITILPVLYSNILNIDLNWVFKVIYPLIFSFVPLTLYAIYIKQTNPRVAFLSVFVFISMEIYYNEMLGLTRQIIAELFFALLILLIVEENINPLKRKIMFIIFSGALIVSHYALSYIFFFYILIMYCLSFLLKRINLNVKNSVIVNSKFVLLFLFLMNYSWYVFVSETASKVLTNVFNNIYLRLSIFTSGLSIGGLMPSYLTPVHEASKYIFYILQFNIIIGIIELVIKYRSRSLEYLSMSLTSMGILVMCILVPGFAPTLDMTRFYHITLFILAPFSILGGLAIIKPILNMKNLRPLKDIITVKSDSGLFPVALLAVLFFLFQVGFIYDITGEIPSSLSLDFGRIKENPLIAVDLWSRYIPEQDVFSAIWLSAHTSNKSGVYADVVSRFQVLTSYGMVSMAYVPTSWDFVLRSTGNHIDGKAYVYLRQFNVVYGIMQGPEAGKLWNTTNISNLLRDLNKLYSNGGSNLYMKT